MPLPAGWVNGRWPRQPGDTVGSTSAPNPYLSQLLLCCSSESLLAVLAGHARSSPPQDTSSFPLKPAAPGVVQVRAPAVHRFPRGRLSPSCPYSSPATKRCEGHLQTSLGCTPLPGALSLRSSPSPAGLPQACSQASSAGVAGRTPLSHRSVSPDGSSLPSGPTSSHSGGPARGSMPSRLISHQPCHAAPLRSQTTSSGTPSLSSSPRPPSSSRLRFPPPAPSVLYHWVSALLVLTVSTFLNPTRAPVHAV